MHTKPLFKTTLVLTIALLATLMAARAAHAQEPVPQSTDPVSNTTPLAAVPGTTDAWWAEVQEHLRRESYKLSPDQTGQRGYNRAHNFVLSFEASGLRLSAGDAGENPRTDQEKEQTSWHWELRLMGYGYVGDARPVRGPLQTTTQGNRFEYRYPSGIVEWYVNDARGLEHGFTLPTPPSNSKPKTRNSKLVLDLALDTDLTPHLSSDRQTIDFLSPGRVTMLRYDHLYVTDATGRQLTAHFELVHHASRITHHVLRITLDATNAVYPLTVDPLASSPSWTATGENTNNSFGTSVASAGDVNGDGYADVIVGAYRYNGFQGRAYVYHGAGAGLAATPALTLTGESTNDYFGVSVASAGDVNGDGYADVIVGAEAYNSTQGRAYVYHGAGAGLAATPALTLTGESTNNNFGWSVASAGDVNGDGYADVIVGAYRYNGFQGRAYVYHGAGAGLAATSALTLTGENTGDWFGRSVASVGDVNGDGYADVIVGAESYPSGGDQGRAYVYHGAGAGLAATPALTLTGESTGDYFGGSVASAGDVNGDGYADVIVGAWGYPSGGDQGRAYVYLGAGAGLAATPALTSTGENIGNWFGASVARAGDVNGDGYADVIVGAYHYNSEQGRAYVYHGAGAGLAAALALTLTGESTYDDFGVSVASAGDVNGDGYADVIVGASRYNSNQGRAYVYHGAGGGLAATPALTLTGESTNNYFGVSVASTGDVNGDGYADVIVGAWGYNFDQGRAYVYHGAGTGLAAAPALTLTGENTGDYFGRSVASVGDVNGDGY
ncbi:MAG: hypothetical protein GY832_00035, partial [Chloroflexi bacterium]|nr:hypothetical protein [Chloroflexota bacterium]